MADQCPDHDDLQCMEQLKAGDDLALNELMQRWKEPLVTFCLRYTGNLADAREITQETFVNVYKSRNRYQPKAAFSTWLFAIAANLCKMRARWKSRHPEVLEAEPAMSTPSGRNSDPRTQTDRQALASDLDNAIQELPHRLRVAFVLREIHGLSVREIATTQGSSEKAAERRLARARERLRRLLQEKWH